MENWRVPSRTARNSTAQPSEHPLLAEEMGRLVGQDHENRADDAFEQTDGSAQAPVPSQNALEVHERVEYLTGLRSHRGLLQQNLLEPRCEHAAQVQNQQQNGNSTDTWQRDVPHP